MPLRPGEIGLLQASGKEALGEQPPRKSSEKICAKTRLQKTNHLLGDQCWSNGEQALVLGLTWVLPYQAVLSQIELGQPAPSKSRGHKRRPSS